jgi:hypothetical protein
MARYQRYRIDLAPAMRGDTFQETFLIGDVLNMSACTIRAQVRRQPDDERVLLDLDVIRDGQTLTLRKAHTAMILPAGRYHYDVEFTLPDGDVFTLFFGTFPVTNDTSR